VPVSLLLATSAQDWIERVSPVVLFVGIVVILVVRARERRSGPDEDGDEDELDG
jgi:hypothetical protein